MAREEGMEEEKEEKEKVSLATHTHLQTLKSLVQGCGHCLGPHLPPECNCHPAEEALVVHCLLLGLKGWQLCPAVAGSEEPAPASVAERMSR